jgi:hypothetical protein
MKAMTLDRPPPTDVQPRRLTGLSEPGQGPGEVLVKLVACGVRRFSSGLGCSASRPRAICSWRKARPAKRGRQRNALAHRVCGP